MSLDLAPGPDESSPESLTVFDDLLYFFSYTTGIWRSDGTVNGTVLVSDQLRSTAAFVQLNGDLYASGQFDDFSWGFLQVSSSPEGGEDSGNGGYSCVKGQCKREKI